MIEVYSIFNTYPEVIKIALGFSELQKHPQQACSYVCIAAQCREMLDQVIEGYVEASLARLMRTDCHQIVAKTEHLLYRGKSTPLWRRPVILSAMVELREES